MTATNQFAKNFNRYGGGDTAPGLDLVYEPLFRLSSKDGGQLLPMLAESADHSEDGMEVTYHLRKDVKWSDGEPFTSRDVLFTLGSIYGTPNPEPAEDEFVWLAAPIETPDDYTVTVKYNEDQRQQEVNLALYYPIVPAHIYQDGDELEFPQDIMDNHRHGTRGAGISTPAGHVHHTGRLLGRDSAVSEAVRPVRQAGNIETQITQGDVDFAEGGAQCGPLRERRDQQLRGRRRRLRGIVFQTTARSPHDRPERPQGHAPRSLHRRDGGSESGTSRTSPESIPS